MRNEELGVRTWKKCCNICQFTWATEAAIAHVDFCRLLHHQSGSACMKQLTRAPKMKAHMALMASCKTMVDTGVSAFTHPANMFSIPVHMLLGGSGSSKHAIPIHAFFTCPAWHTHIPRSRPLCRCRVCDGGSAASAQGQANRIPLLRAQLGFVLGSQALLYSLAHPLGLEHLPQQCLQRMHTLSQRPMFHLAGQTQALPLSAWLISQHDCDMAHNKVQGQHIARCAG
jgi:hypothetical protein